MSDEYDDEETGDPSPDSEAEESIVYRTSAGDPIFGLLLVGAVSLGLTPLIPDAADFRYTIIWGLLALFGVLAWLIGNGPRIEQERPENLAWGLVMGLILGTPLLAFGGSNLSEAANLMFPNMSTGTVLAYIVFVMPMGETLYFRGLLQQNMSFWSNGLACTAWQMVLFFPLINRGPYPLIVGVVVLMANTMYSYVRERNGLAAAWVCQIVVNVLLIFVPFAT